MEAAPPETPGYKAHPGHPAPVNPQTALNHSSGTAGTALLSAPLGAHVPSSSLCPTCCWAGSSTQS